MRGIIRIISLAACIILGWTGLARAAGYSDNMERSYNESTRTTTYRHKAYSDIHSEFPQITFAVTHRDNSRQSYNLVLVISSLGDERLYPRSIDFAVHKNLNSQHMTVDCSKNGPFTASYKGEELDNGQQLEVISLVFSSSGRIHMIEPQYLQEFVSSDYIEATVNGQRTEAAYLYDEAFAESLLFFLELIGQQYVVETE